MRSLPAGTARAANASLPISESSLIPLCCFTAGLPFG